MKVFLVVDMDYGARVESLLSSGPVWLVGSDVNRRIAEEYWQRHPKPERDAVLTTFDFAEDDSPSEIALKMLHTIDLHHGEYSGGYSVLELIGVELSSPLRAALIDLGFSKFESTHEGFRASPRGRR